MKRKEPIETGSIEHKRYLNIIQAADLTGFTVGTLYQYVSEKKVPYIKKGRAVRFDKNKLIKWMDAGSVEMLPVPEKRKGGLWKI